jgi:peptidoglycan/LPS O-acetylase OafA/YrhL
MRDRSRFTTNLPSFEEASMGSHRLPRESLAAACCAAGLAGMAYCHIKDVGMKFDEHVYYMAGLFCCNIAASIALVPLVIAASRLSMRKARMVWASAGALAALTIAGFAWSRTIGFPQMEDHVGEWDRLGMTSLVFEGLVVAVSAAMLFDSSRQDEACAVARR